MSDTPSVIGHYFEFKRGTWVIDGEGKKKQFDAGGLTYVGSLTEAGKLGLDELINEYVAKEGAKTRQETEDVCAHRHYKTHCRICRITQLETELAQREADLKLALDANAAQSAYRKQADADAALKCRQAAKLNSHPMWVDACDTLAKHFDAALSK